MHFLILFLLSCLVPYSSYSQGSIVVEVISLSDTLCPYCSFKKKTESSELFCIVYTACRVIRYEWQTSVGLHRSHSTFNYHHTLFILMYCSHDSLAPVAIVTLLDNCPQQLLFFFFFFNPLPPSLLSRKLLSLQSTWIGPSAAVSGSQQSQADINSSY